MMDLFSLVNRQGYRVMLSGVGMGVWYGIRVHGGHLYPLPQRLCYDSSLSAAAE